MLPLKVTHLSKKTPAGLTCTTPEWPAHACSIWYYWSICEIRTTFQRRTSKEGVISPAPPEVGDEDEGSGSTDPLLQIPTELSAVLTLKRGGASSARGSTHSASSTFRPSTSGNSSDKNTPNLLKRKRESIVWGLLAKKVGQGSSCCFTYSWLKNTNSRGLFDFILKSGFCLHRPDGWTEV